MGGGGTVGKALWANAGSRAKRGASSGKRDRLWNCPRAFIKKTCLLHF